MTAHEKTTKRTATILIYTAHVWNMYAGFGMYSTVYCLYIFDQHMDNVVTLTVDPHRTVS